MTIIWSNPISLKPGENISPAIEIDDTVEKILVSIFRWNGRNSVSIEVDLSFDSGVTWGWRCGIGALTPQELDEIKIQKPNSSGNQEMIYWCHKMCVCGEPFLPGHPLNRPQPESNHLGLTRHCNFTPEETALMSTWDGVVFHIPDDQPMTGLPLRQVRAVATASGNANTVVQVETL